VLSGAYTLVSGCTNLSDECKSTSAYGSLEGTFEVKTGDAGEFLDWKENLKYFSCPSIGTAWVDLGGKHTISGNTVSLTRFGTPVVYEYCVMGDDLWLANAKDSFSRLTVHRFKRK